MWFSNLSDLGGAGGKGTWGRLGDEISQTPFLDDHDPNYDSEELVTDLSHLHLLWFFNLKGWNNLQNIKTCFDWWTSWSRNHPNSSWIFWKYWYSRSYRELLHHHLILFKDFIFQVTSSTLNVDGKKHMVRIVLVVMMSLFKSF